MAHFDLAAPPLLRRAFPAPADSQARARRLRLALGVFIVAAIALGFLAAGERYLGDPDTLWHVTVGADIWKSGRLPHVDEYSHSFAGEPWIAKEWLSQVILFAVYAAGGWNGVVIFCLALTAIVVAQIYAALSGLIRPTYAAAATACITAMISTVFLARPHLVVMPVMLAFVFTLISRAQRGAAPPFALLALMCLWSNLHGSFTFGWVAAAFAFMMFFAEHRKARSALTVQWLLFLGLCPFVSMIHPYGFEAIWSTVVIVNSEALPYINEWRAFSAQSDGLWEAGLLAIVAVLALGRLRLDIVSIVFICFLAHMFLTHFRFVYLFFTIAPVLIAHAASKQTLALSFASWSAQAGADALERRLANAAPLVVASVAFAALCALSLAAVKARWTPLDTYPEAAIKAAREHGVSGNVINDYDFGGALIFEREPTFVDGRADRLFQNGFMDDIERSRQAGGAAILENQIARYGIGWSLLRPSDPRNAILTGLPEWRLVYADDLAVVYARNGD